MTRRIIAISATATAVAVPPPVLTLAVISNSEIDITATWNIPPPIISIQIERALLVGGPYATVALQPRAFFADASLVPSTTYYYRAKLMADDGRVSAYSSIVNATTPA